MHAISNGEKVGWNGTPTKCPRWNPCYVPRGAMFIKFLNGKIHSYHWDDYYHKPTDFHTDY